MSDPETPADPFERVASLTRIARGTWLGLLSYLAFVGVTLLGVEDADFFLVERQTDLPLIGVSIPTNLFFYIAPVLGAMLYIHLHLYLLKLWKALNDLPANNDTPPGERITPWIVSDMALAGKPGASHTYPLRVLANWVTWLAIFAFGPIVLAAFWWRSMPKHDELLTIVFCGVPLFLAVLAGVESWRALRRGGAEERHMALKEKAGWVTGLLGLSAVGFLTTEGTLGAYAQIDRISVLGEELRFRSVRERYQTKLVEDLGKLDAADLRTRFAGLTEYPDSEDLHHLADRELETRWWMQTWFPGLLRPARLQGVSFVETPPDWRPRDEAEQRFRSQWCAAQGIPLLACGPGPLARDAWGDRLSAPPHLAYQREEWCKKVLGSDTDTALCTERFAELDARYSRDWQKARRDALAALPRRDLSGADLRNANLGGARMEGAVLREARMEKAVLREARMEGADLERARMEGADLSWARFPTSLSAAASMTGAALREVDVTNIDLSQEQVKTLFGDASVTLPEGIERPKHWSKWELPFGGEHAFHDEWRKWRADPEGYDPPKPPE